MIHATAQIDASAKLGANVSVGAFSVIDAEVEIGDGTTIAPHVVIQGPTRIGRNNRIAAFASIGGDSQDKKFEGERSELVIGDDNLIREFVTINRGDKGGATRIGNNNWILAYAHIAHGCIVGSHTVFSNNATLAGHVEIGDHVILSGFAGVHQFCRVGEHAFIGMGVLLSGDVPPFMMIAADADTQGRPRGINSEGLKRRGFSPERIAAIKRAYKTLYVAKIPFEEAREELARIAAAEPDVARMLDFIERGQRSLVR